MIQGSFRIHLGRMFKEIKGRGVQDAKHPGLAEGFGGLPGPPN